MTTIKITHSKDKIIQIDDTFPINTNFRWRVLSIINQYPLTALGNLVETHCICDIVGEV